MKTTRQWLIGGGGGYKVGEDGLRASTWSAEQAMKIYHLKQLELFYIYLLTAIREIIAQEGFLR